MGIVLVFISFFIRCSSIYSMDLSKDTFISNGPTHMPLQESVQAEWELAHFYYKGEGGREPNPEEAFKWYKFAADHGFADAQCVLGNLYYYGDGIEPDIREAFKCYKRAADQGCEAATECLTSKQLVTLNGDDFNF